MTPVELHSASAIGHRDALARAGLRDLPQTILEQTGQAVIATDLDGTIIYFNRAAQALLGYGWDEVVARCSPLTFLLPEELAARGRQLVPRLELGWARDFSLLVQGLPAAGVDAQRWTLQRKDGHFFSAWLSISVLSDTAEQPCGYLLLVSTSEVPAAEVEELQTLALAFESQAAIMITDAQQVILRVNPAFSRLTGYRPEEAIGQTPRMLKSGRQSEAFYRELWSELASVGHWEGEIWNRRRSGEVYPEWLTIRAVGHASGAVTHYVATFSDISKLKQAEEAARHLAYYDALTGLPNRRLLLERLAVALAGVQQHGRYGALLMFDLDRFQSINDVCGHALGDRLLRAVAERAQRWAGSERTLARLGGDKFVVLLESLGGTPEAAGLRAEQAAEALRLQLAAVYELPELNDVLACTASIGLILFQTQDKSSEILLKQLDIALTKAKEAGRNTIRFFDDRMQQAMDRRLSLESGLRRALAENELILFVQPQVDPARRLIGAECLLRWQPPGQPMIAPGEFIPLAEETGLILPIGQWVLDNACAHLRRWADSPVMSRLDLAVNVSARQFRQPDFVWQVQSALERHGVDPRRLKLEVTESLLLDNADDVVSKMQQLIDLGVRFSLDDFGTGYASLAYLKRYPFEQLKVDRSFIRDLGCDRDDAAIVGAILAMGNALRLNVVAEGVEEGSQLSFLVEHGCRYFQGYLFGRPMSFAEFEQLVPLETCGRFPGSTQAPAG
ncbi:EAL domain-containing protein [Dechloromonas sp. ZY10]|uniref:EAL domain-containing protein n=1 Tax=Dechloromonas aquae TaxID=2664436 RepID=UPI003528727B